MASTKSFRCDPSGCGSAALTEEQRRFAAENHDLVYRFLHWKGWAVGEYYDIAALGYLSAVWRYHTRPELRRYAFSTVAWQSMERSISSFRRAESRRQEAEQRYMDSIQAVSDPVEELEARLILHDLALISSPEQYEMASLRAQGYTIRETARSLGIDVRRVRKLLRELYRVYLQLYMN